MFKATSEITEVVEHNDSFIVDRWCEIETPNGWVFADNVKINDNLFVSENDLRSKVIVTSIDYLNDKIHIKFKEVVE